MSERTEACPSCSTAVDAAVPGGFLRCTSCGLRFPRPAKRGRRSKARAAGDGLDIHPALARRYRARENSGEEPVPPPPPGENLSSIKISPSLMEETDEPHQGAARLRDTRPIRASAASGRNTTPSTVSGAPANIDAATDTPQLPGLRMLERVGKGAMGAVYRAVEEATGKQVAVKVLAPELAARADFIARFEREATALGRVRHPGVVSTLRSGKTEAPHASSNGASEEGGIHFLCMEFVEGSSLRRVLDGGPLPPGRALRFARQIVQGLGAAHDVGVIHRDLKPENILVTNEGDEDERLVLVDFGLAGITDAEQDPHPNLTKSRMTMGTVNYMAPEQRTDAKRVNHRADLYAAGVILYELLTGDLPLGRFALPTERGQILPSSIDDVIVRALARVPDERYQSAEELDAALVSVQNELTAAAANDTIVGQTATMTRVVGDDLDGAPTVMSAARSDIELESDRVELAPTPEPAASPEWLTAPPWVRRPELVWGVIALAAGAIVGVMVGPFGIFDRGGHAAPALAQTTAGTYGPGVDADGPAWEADEPGWRRESGTIHFDGAPTGALSLARAPRAKLAAALSAAIQTPGGIGVVDERNDGVVLLVEDGGCRAALVVRGAPQPGVPVGCAEPASLSCDLAGWCLANGSRIQVPLLKERARSVALVCAGRSCTFPGE